MYSVDHGEALAFEDFNGRLFAYASFLKPLAEPPEKCRKGAECDLWRERDALLLTGRNVDKENKTHRGPSQTWPREIAERIDEQIDVRDRRRNAVGNRTQYAAGRLGFSERLPRFCFFCGSDSRCHHFDLELGLLALAPHIECACAEMQQRAEYAPACCVEKDVRDVHASMPINGLNHAAPSPDSRGSDMGKRITGRLCPSPVLPAVRRDSQTPA